MISPAERIEDMGVSIDQFRLRLISQWPHCKIFPRVDENSPYALSWLLENEDNDLEGFVKDDLSVIVLDGSLELCANTAIWFRSIIPGDRELFFYDIGFNQHIELDAITKEEDIIRLFN